MVVFLGFSLLNDAFFGLVSYNDLCNTNMTQVSGWLIHDALMRFGRPVRLLKGLDLINHPEWFVLFLHAGLGT